MKVVVLLDFVNKYFGPYCRAEMYAGHVAYTAPWWVTVIEPTGQTDGQTPDRYVTLSATDLQGYKVFHFNLFVDFVLQPS